MKKALAILAVVLLLCAGLLSTDQAKSPAQKGKITRFTASDMPNDDGAGVILKWKPLDKANRIIQYNIYRGVSPDSLFLISTMEVDPKMGVLAPELFFYDRGDQPLVEFESAPMKLKHEKQQTPQSPLYRKFPQDPALLGSMIGRLNFMGGIKYNKLYHKVIPVKHKDELLTGIKMYNFEYLFGMPMAGQTYYYTVLGINEKGSLLPYADIQKVVPVDNPPDNKAVVYSTYVQDKGILNFEWIPSVSNPDIAAWEGWLVPKSLIPEGQEQPTSDWQSSSTLLFQLPHYYGPGTLYHQVDTKQEGIALPANIEGYTTVLTCTDYSGQSATKAAKSFRIINSQNLPSMPGFSIHDKKNDKGDNLVVSMGKPLAYMTVASFTNHFRKAIKVNYELADNPLHRIDQLRFEILSPNGTSVSNRLEHYLDKSVILNLPEQYRKENELTLRILVKTDGNKLFEHDYTEQKIVFDPVNKFFKGQQLYLSGDPVGKEYLDIMTKSKLDPTFLFGNRTNAITRSYDHSVPYEDVLYQGITGFDKKTRTLLIEPQVSIDAVPDSGYSFSIPLFRQQFDKDMKDTVAEIDRLKKAAAAYPAGAVPDSISANLAGLEDNYNYIISHPEYKAAVKAKSDRQWRKMLIKAHTINLRSYAYRLLKTDGKAAFVMTDIYHDKNGNQWFTPYSEWIDSTKILTFFVTLFFCLMIVFAIIQTRRRDPYIRPIAGLHEIDNAVGRATEMGRPIMFVPGWGTIGEVDTIASMMILSQIAKKAAEFDIRIMSPHCDYLVLPMAQEIVQTAFSESGRPDAYNQNDIFYVSGDQFPFCAGVNGITVRERVATIFYMGYFNAEALLLTETGNQAGAIQIAGTDAVTQIPFFITTCDYTLIGEEFYAASAYLSRNPELVSMLKAQDYFKLFMVISMILGTILSTLHWNAFINLFPVE